MAQGRCKRASALIAIALATTFLQACAGLQDPQYDADVSRLDPNICVATPRHLPDCVNGFMVYVRWAFREGLP